MTEVVSIKFKSCGKSYYFAPPFGQIIDVGDKVIVETARGLEMAECCRTNRLVEDASVVQPLRPVIRKATEQDFKTVEENKQREKDAFNICQTKIDEHELDMKLVNVECSFDGTKITFFFTSEGRVDFRELVKDLASTFHNRIELRQIGVRDEAKMIGGIGICGRPYCCSQFLDDFAPVSTKMAKIQNLSLNPTKISGSCGRLMCCLRYEEDAYEELVANVPKAGAFVETPDGYGTAVSIDLLKQMVTVRLDTDGEDSSHIYKAVQVAAVPGGRPKPGEPVPHVLDLDKQFEDEEEDVPEIDEDFWSSPSLFAESPEEITPSSHEKDDPSTVKSEAKKSSSKSRRSRGRRGGNPKNGQSGAPSQNAKSDNAQQSKPSQPKQPQEKQKTSKQKTQPKPKAPQPSASSPAPSGTGAAQAKPKSSNKKKKYYKGGKHIKKD